MGNTTSTKILRNNDNVAAILIGMSSDGTAETDVLKVDIDTLVMAATKVTITKLIWLCDRVQVKVAFNHTAPDVVAMLAGSSGQISDENECPIQDPGSAGGTGDIQFSTLNTVAGSGYTIYMEIRKVA